jgi:hypothetical protein
MSEFAARPRDDQRDDQYIYYSDSGIPTAAFVEDFPKVSARLERCRETISKIVKDHWNFRDLTTPIASVHIEGE